MDLQKADRKRREKRLLSVALVFTELKGNSIRLGNLLEDINSNFEICKILILKNMEPEVRNIKQEVEDANYFTSETENFIFKNTDSNVQDILLEKMNIKQEIQIDPEMISNNCYLRDVINPTFEDSHFTSQTENFIFKNTDSNVQDIDVVNNGSFLETMNIKQEIQICPEMISSNCYLRDVVNPTFKDSHFTSQTENFIFKNTDSNVQDIDVVNNGSLLETMNIKQEIQIDPEMISSNCYLRDVVNPTFEDSHFTSQTENFIFRNTDSNVQDIDVVNNGSFLETMNIKQEIQIDPEMISSNCYLRDVINPTFEESHFTSQTENCIFDNTDSNSQNFDIVKNEILVETVNLKQEIHNHPEMISDHNYHKAQMNSNFDDCRFTSQTENFMFENTDSNVQGSNTVNYEIFEETMNIKSEIPINPEIISNHSYHRDVINQTFEDGCVKNDMETSYFDTSVIKVEIENNCSQCQTMGTGLSNLNQSVHVELQEEIVETDHSNIGSFEFRRFSDTPNSISDCRHENIDTELQNMKQESVIDTGNVENMTAYVENIPATVEISPAYVENMPAYVENIPAYVENIPAHIENMPAHIENIPAHIENADNIYIYENIESNVQDVDPEYNGILIERININQEIQNHVDMISDHNYCKDVMNSNSVNSHFSIQRDNFIYQNTDSTVHDNEQAINGLDVEAFNIKQEIQNSQEMIFEHSCHKDVINSNLEDSHLESLTDDCVIENTDLFGRDIENEDYGLLVETVNIKQEIHNLPLMISDHIYCKNVISSNFEDSHITSWTEKLLFENTDSNAQDNGNVNNVSVVETMDIKEEIQNHPDIISEHSYCKNMIKSTFEEDSFTSFSNNDRRTCTVCKRRFLSVEILKRHLITHSTERPHLCSECGSGFQTAIALQQHVVTHSTRPPNQCTVCDKGFNTLQRLRQHMVSHINGKPHQCRECNKGFKTVYNLRKHMISHSYEEVHKCSVCNKGFKSVYNLRKHMISHSYEEVHKCSVCDKGFKNLYYFRQHMTSHSNGKPHQCSVCAKKLQTLTGLKSHMFTHSTERPHECNLCGRTFKMPNNLKRHMNGHSTERPFLCTVCGKTFQIYNCLKRHMWSHSNEKLHQCSVCGKKVKTVTALKSHMFTHSTEKPHQCSVCVKKFQTLRRLKSHMFTHSTERPHQCNFCGKQFKISNTLKEHLRSHSTDQPYLCNVCGKTFPISWQLRRHMISHSTERPHPCNKCRKEFRTESHLRRHLAIHGTERPHQCNECDKGFKTVNDLNYHMISHMPPQHHQCNVCDKAFKTVKHLRRHATVHSTERPHQCSVCDKRFKTGSSLRQHIAIHNKNQQPHQCNVCDKKFKTAANLRRHIDIHNTEQPHQCNECGTGFKTMDALKYHLFSHSCGQPHQCSGCDRLFKTKESLRKHMVSHSTERPHHSTERPHECNV